MQISHEIELVRTENPMDVVERLASANGWEYEREEADEITLSVEGAWGSYHVIFNWLQDIETLHVSCGFDLKTNGHQRPSVKDLVAAINEKLWLGHFDLWSTEGIVMHRHGLLLSGGTAPTEVQCAGLLETTLSTCERYYQAFQFVLWAGMTPGIGGDGDAVRVIS